MINITIRFFRPFCYIIKQLIFCLMVGLPVNCIFIAMNSIPRLNRAFEIVKNIMRGIIGELLCVLNMGIIVFRLIGNFFKIERGGQHKNMLVNLSIFTFFIADNITDNTTTNIGSQSADMSSIALALFFGFLSILMILLYCFHNYYSFLDYAMYSLLLNAGVILGLWMTNFTGHRMAPVDPARIGGILNNFFVVTDSSMCSENGVELIDRYIYAGLLLLLPLFLFLSVLFLGTMEGKK